VLNPRRALTAPRDSRGARPRQGPRKLPRFTPRISAHFHAAGAGYSTAAYDPISAFLPSRLLKWIPQVAKYWFHKKHAFRDYTTHGKGTGIYPIDDRVKISMAGDWGTGTDEARIVAAAMKKSEADFTIHLGDVYYVGDSNEVRENFLGEKTSPYAPVKWPMGRKAASHSMVITKCMLTETATGK